MKGFRFYEEMTHKRKQVSAGNIVAVSTETLFSGQRFLDALAAIFDTPNSPVNGTTVCPQWLRSNCKRVSEVRAREVHPALFARLDDVTSEQLSLGVV